MRGGTTPESAIGGGSAWLRTGDRIRIYLNAGRCDALVPDEEIAARRKALAPAAPESHTPWKEVFGSTVGTLQNGGRMELAVKYRAVLHKLPRHNPLTHRHVRQERTLAASWSRTPVPRPFAG